MALMKEKTEARHLIMAKVVNKAESVFVTYDDPRAQHVMVAITAKQVEEAGYAAVAQTRMRPGT